MTFGEKLKSLRNRHSITQEELVYMLNKYCKKNKINVTFTEQQVKQWEGDYNLPNIERSIAISKFFNTTLDALFKPENRVRTNRLMLQNINLN